MIISPDRARTALAMVRIVNGAAALVAPTFLLRRVGTDTTRDTSGVYPFRMFGIRTVLIGADLLTLTGAERARAERLAVLIHATDTISAATAGVQGHLPRRSALLTTAISAGNTALAVIAASDHR